MLAAGSILVMGPAASAATSHTGVVSTSPKKGAKLAKPPKAVTVTFSQEIRGGSIVVRRAGTVVSLGSGGKDPRDVRRLRVVLKNGLGAGLYKVRWRVEAADGHEQSGGFSFMVKR
jgi:methionine-rich copper-binding protein CopC